MRPLKLYVKVRSDFETVADFTYAWEYWVDAEGNFLYVSPSCERITGYSAKEFMSDPDLMNRIIHPDDLTEMLDHYHNVRKVTPDAVETRDFRIIRRDGAIRWVGHVCQPVYGQDGQSLGRRGSNRDITERKIGEETLRTSEERFRSMFEKHNAVMLLIEPVTGKIVNANKAAERFYGYTLSQLFSMSIQDINSLPPDEIKEQWNLALKEERQHFIFPHRLANGEVRNGGSSLVPD